MNYHEAIAFKLPESTSPEAFALLAWRTAGRKIPDGGIDPAVQRLIITVRGWLTEASRSYPDQFVGAAAQRRIGAECADAIVRVTQRPDATVLLPLLVAPGTQIDLSVDPRPQLTGEITRLAASMAAQITPFAYQ
ncbi:hypothetical protein [Aquihabitans sp. McL0605]|uniref:hypothetical protein n=1 Tax=Aquihabitans sp. McL0605 TaxID=3415671 RepID=UPI003CE7FE2B